MFPGPPVDDPPRGFRVFHGVPVSREHKRRGGRCRCYENPKRPHSFQLVKRLDAGFQRQADVTGQGQFVSLTVEKEGMQTYSKACSALMKKIRTHNTRNLPRTHTRSSVMHLQETWHLCPSVKIAFQGTLNLRRGPQPPEKRLIFLTRQRLTCSH